MLCLPMLGKILRGNINKPRRDLESLTLVKSFWHRNCSCLKCSFFVYKVNFIYLFSHNGARAKQYLNASLMLAIMLIKKLKRLLWLLRKLLDFLLIEKMQQHWNMDRCTMEECKSCRKSWGQSSSEVEKQCFERISSVCLCENYTRTSFYARKYGF